METGVPSSVMMPVVHDPPGGERLVVRVPLRVFQPHQARCQANHGQPLAVIRARGGLSLGEAAAILGDLPYRGEDLNRDLPILVRGWVIDEVQREHARQPPSTDAMENAFDDLFAMLRSCAKAGDQVTSSVVRGERLNLARSQAAGQHVFEPTAAVTITIRINGGAERVTLWTPRSDDHVAGLKSMGPSP